MIELADAPVWNAAPIMGTNIAAVVCIFKPKDVAAAVTSGNASAILLRERVVLFSAKLKKAIAPSTSAIICLRDSFDVTSNPLSVLIREIV